MNQPSTNDPLKKPLILGVSGHRKAADLYDLAALRAKLVHELHGILTLSIETLEGRSVHLYSPLAEGADRLFVDAAWEVNSALPLVVVLPFAREAYEATFDAPDAVCQFHEYLRHPACHDMIELPHGRPGDFVAVGKYLVDHADIMFFLHNGKEIGAEALDGGTGSILRYALNDPGLKYADVPGLIPEIPPLEKPVRGCCKRPLSRVCYINTRSLESAWVNIPA